MLESVVRFSAHGRPRALELLRSALEGEGLERVEAEAARVRVERGQGCSATGVGEPGPGLEPPRDLGDRGVGHAEQDELGAFVAQFDAALAEAGEDCRADAARADDLDGFDCHLAPVP